MRRKNALYAIIATVLICSCAKEQTIITDINKNDSSVILTAGLEQPSDTKTAIQSDGGVFWGPSEEIMVFNGTKSGKFSSTNSESATSATFKGNMAINDGDEIWALYPYNENAVFADGIITTTIPSEQVACAGTFARNTNVAVAHSTSTTLQFYNVCGGVRFSVTEEGINKVIFEGLDGEMIAGKVTIGFEDGLPVVQSITNASQLITLSAPEGGSFEIGEWYYIVTIPGAMEKGFKMLFYTDDEMAVCDHAPVEVKRSVFGSLDSVDSSAEYCNIDVLYDNFLDVDDIIQESLIPNDGAQSYEALQNIIESVQSSPVCESFSVDDDYAVLNLINGLTIEYPISDESIFDNTIAPETKAESSKVHSPDKFNPNASVFIFNLFSEDKSRDKQNDIVDATAKLFTNVCNCGKSEFTAENLATALKKQGAMVFINTYGSKNGKTIAVGNETTDWLLAQKHEYLGFEYDVTDKKSRIKDYYVVNVQTLIDDYARCAFVYFASCNTLSNLITKNTVPCIVGWDGINKCGQAYGLIIADYLSTHRIGIAGFREDFEKDGIICDPIKTNTHMVFKGNQQYTTGNNRGLSYYKSFNHTPKLTITDPVNGARIKGSSPNFKVKLSYNNTSGVVTDGKTEQIDGKSYRLAFQNFYDDIVYSDHLLIKNNKCNYTSPHFRPGVCRIHIKEEPSDYFSVAGNDFAYVIISHKFENNDGETDENMPAPEIETISASYDGNETTFSCAVVNMDGSSLEKGVCYWKENSPNEKISVKSNDRSSNYFVKVYNLDSNQRYVVCGYAVGEDGVTYYGNNLNFSPGWMTPPETMDYVDLGLPSGLKWATCNLGASKPEDYGGFYLWAGLNDVSGTWNWYSYPYHTEIESVVTGWTKYIPYNFPSYWSGEGNPDNKSRLDPEDDVAMIKLGDNWQMPTAADFLELTDNCDSEWTVRNGVYGRTFTSKTNGNSIFLPATGYYGVDSFRDSASSAMYLTSDLDIYNPQYSQVLYLTAVGFNLSSGYRGFGCPVRPVFVDSAIGKSELSISPEIIDFGNVALGETSTKTITITNTGSRYLTVSNVRVTLYTGEYSCDWTSGIIRCGESKTVKVTFTPKEETTFNDYLYVRSDADNVVGLIKSIPIRGRGVDLSQVEYVDMGLPSGLKWATRNLGASKPEAYGDFYAWGETEPYYTEGNAFKEGDGIWKAGKSEGYSWSSYKWYDQTNQVFTKYLGGEDLELEDDAAHVKLGGKWRMPTYQEFLELFDNCDYNETTLNEVSGIMFISKNNGNILFFPANTAFRLGTKLWGWGLGYYWTSSSYHYYLDIDAAHDIDIERLGVTGYPLRCYGKFVRPVLE